LTFIVPEFMTIDTPLAGAGVVGTCRQWQQHKQQDRLPRVLCQKGHTMRI
jgi:hypothetical protein